MCSAWWIQLYCEDAADNDNDEYDHNNDVDDYEDEADNDNDDHYYRFNQSAQKVTIGFLMEVKISFKFCFRNSLWSV